MKTVSARGSSFFHTRKRHVSARVQRENCTVQLSCHIYACLPDLNENRLKGKSHLKSSRKIKFKQASFHCVGYTVVSFRMAWISLRTEKSSAEFSSIKRYRTRTCTMDHDSSHSILVTAHCNKLPLGESRYVGIVRKWDIFSFFSC